MVCKFASEYKNRIMIELNEKASVYAKENVISVLQEAFAKVYADGYRDGYKDREEMIPVDLRNNTTEFVDLGLPSGTLWASNYEKEDENSLYLPYDVAKIFNLPTKEQWEELKTCCNWVIKPKTIYCVGPNGKCLNFTSTGFIKIRKKVYDDEEIYFWIDDNDNNYQKTAARIWRVDVDRFNSQSIKYFSGYKLPVRQVRVK